MAKRSLTATQVAALDKQGVHWIAPSLYMQIRPQGTRSWLFRYGKNGENQWLGLGAVADKPLSEARDDAAELRGRAVASRYALPLRIAAAHEAVTSELTGTICDMAASGLNLEVTTARTGRLPKLGPR